MKCLGKQLVMVMILSGVVFLLIPIQLGFERVEPQDPFDQGLLVNLFTIDLPHNPALSLHVVFSVAIVLAVLEGVRMAG